jgi:uncharacterized membrane-anchored protein
MSDHPTTRLTLAAVLLALTATFAFAQDDETYDLSAEEQQQMEYYRAVLESLDPKTGDIKLSGNLATLHVPENFYFLDSDDAEKVLVDLWGNPPGQDVLGMLLPERYSPLDYESWAVTIDYVADGWVTDEDAADIDYDDLLKDMQDDIRDSNPDRIAEGYGSIELLGWAEAPHYDSINKKLYWAKELRFDGSEDTTLNYEIRALGRRGILTMTFIANGNQLYEINASRESVLAMAEFNDGNRYLDFDPSVDEVAAYGLGALVAGKIAAKTGLLTAAILLLKKFGVFLLVGLAAFGRKLKGLFTTDKLEPK